MATRLTISDDPPALTRGRAIPLAGSRPVTTPMFTSAGMPSIAVIPTASSDPKASGARRATRRPRQMITTKHEQHHGGADQPLLFGDHGEDVVVLRLGQVEHLLDARHEPLAPHAAGADGDPRLNRLEPLAQGIGVRVQPDRPAARGCAARAAGRRPAPAPPRQPPTATHRYARPETKTIVKPAASSTIPPPMSFSRKISTANMTRTTPAWNHPGSSALTVLEPTAEHRGRERDRDELRELRRLDPDAEQPQSTGAPPSFRGRTARTATSTTAVTPTTQSSAGRLQRLR